MAIGTTVALGTVGGGSTSAAASSSPGSPPPVSSRPYASLPHLGPAPQRCFPYGSSDNICDAFSSAPYPPNANYLYSTYYGTVYLGPHIVGVGQDVTATEVPQQDGRPQWAVPEKVVSGCRDGKYQVVNPQVVRTIVPADTTCTWKATTASAYPPDASAPGGGWSTYTMSFCGFNGCAESQDFYYVLPRKRAISGTVTTTAETSTGQVEILPVANAVIEIAGPESGTAVTDASGFYDALVDPGTYHVEVDSVDGQSAAAAPSLCEPGEAAGAGCVVQTQAEDAAANFQVCPSVDAAGAAGGAGASRAELAVAPTSAPARYCPLSVSVTRLEPTSSAGLGYIGKITNNTDTSMTESPAFVRRLAGTASISDPLVKGPSEDDKLVQKCLSGCTDFLVTVRDKSSGDPVEGATVTASVTPITGGAGYPEGVRPGSGFLCSESILTGSSLSPVQTASCYPGTTISASDKVVTNADGHVLLQYWAPGLLNPKTVTFNVVARTPQGCVIASHVCLLGGEGALQPPLRVTVAPNLIYHADAQLDDDLVSTLAKWADPPNLHDFLLDPAAFVIKKWTSITLKDAVGALVKEMPLPVQAIWKVSTYLDSLSTLQLQELGFVLGVFKPLGLSPLGLDDTETSGYSPAGQLVNTSFLALMAAPPTTLSIGSIPLGSTSISVHNVPIGGIKVADAGVLWQWGASMNLPADGDNIHSYETEDSAAVDVYEVSFCDQSMAITYSSACGPGYAQQGTTRDNDLSGPRDQGIEPYLYLHFAFADYDPVTRKPYVTVAGKSATFSADFLIPYNATVWMESQFVNKSVPPE